LRAGTPCRAATLILRAPNVDSSPAQEATDVQNTGESLWPTITLSTIDDHLRRTQGGGEFRATDKVIRKPLVFQPQTSVVITPQLIN
jgi:hypothetical protein